MESLSSSYLGPDGQWHIVGYPNVTGAGFVDLGPFVPIGPLSQGDAMLLQKLDDIAATLIDVKTLLLEIKALLEAKKQ